ncbi:MAG TPA: succinate dehydrogenase, cytochrome b556 subunit [Devosiaceae bacterium]|jgi:succinate dehydrogenase / fumarate reductase cytochrome b subunit|nr:succinate dehydrogenase, cytochrome b556 subunit [Devosiaceae bacterium]
MPTHSRPLSPHLSIYRFTITMAMSIAHRVTGIGLYLGTLLLALWFVSAAFGDGSLSVVHAIFGSWIGQIILFLATWALFHHLLGGIRHFIWDSGNGFSREARFGLAWANIVASILLTLIAWAIFVWF